MVFLMMFSLQISIIVAILAAFISCIAATSTTTLLSKPSTVNHLYDKYNNNNNNNNKANTSTKQHNILFFFPDQWRFDWLDLKEDKYLSEHDRENIPLQMPNIQQLAKTGTRFLNAFVPSPVCAPSRSCLASGREYDFAGVATNTINDYPIKQTTIYKALQDAGYHTMTVGKDDLTKASALGTKDDKYPHSIDFTGEFHQIELGFSTGRRCAGKEDVVHQHEPYEMYGHFLEQQTVTLKDGSQMTGWEAHYDCFKNRNEPCTSEMYPDHLYEDDFIKDNAIELLKNKPENKPFFMQVNFAGPHPPFLVTSNFTKLVENVTFPKPLDNPNGESEVCFVNGQPQNNDRCSYAAEIENIDFLIGQIIQQLDNKERENTIICFSSDHGEMLGDHGDVGKSQPWGQSIDVPLICTGPGIVKGALISNPVAIVDLAATFLDYGNAKKPAGMTSQSLRPFLEQGKLDKSKYRKYIFSGLQDSPFEGDGFPTYIKNDMDKFEDDDYYGFNLNDDENWVDVWVDDDDARAEDLEDSRLSLRKKDPFAFRLVIEVDTGFKYICCQSDCPGKPYNVPSAGGGDMELLYNVNDDPYDLHPINNQEIMDRLREQLPSNFKCNPRPLLY